jgi:glucoamylase
VILGLLHGNMNDGFFAMNDTRVQATLEKLIRAFAQLYPINQRADIPGVAIGRYPEDRYSGTGLNGGNPWVLCTLAFAEAFYEASRLEAASGHYQKAAEYANRADQFVERVRYHAHKDGSLNEQIDRNSGYMTSVEDLTWNYAAIITTRLKMLKVSAK